MPQFDVALQHQTGLAHHVNQGRTWLGISTAGENTAALSCAALELRFAIERLAVHYWTTLLNGRPQDEDWKGVGSFKRL